MENMELLQAMRQMMEEVVSPIYERLDRMDERLDKMDERLEKVEALATKTQLTIENDISPKIKLLFEGQMSLQNRLTRWMNVLKKSKLLLQKRSLPLKTIFLRKSNCYLRGKCRCKIVLRSLMRWKESCVKFNLMF